MKKSWALLLVVAVVSAVLAEKPKLGFDNGSELLAAIREAERSLETNNVDKSQRDKFTYTMGFFTGALGHALIWSEIDKQCPFKLPEGSVSVEQLMRLTGKWLREHPEWLHETENFAVLMALKETFPRPKPEGGK